MLQLFIKFFTLGCVSFGGPMAHIGYFRNCFVEKEKWISEQQYAQFVALSQFLPGPGSSQVGFSIGYQRAGLLGGIIAFLGFTLPSFILMVIVAATSASLNDNSFWLGIVSGLKILALVVVVDAIWGMFHRFCKCQLTYFIAVASALLLLLFPSILMQISLLIATSVIGKFYLSNSKIAQSATPSSTPIKAWRLFNWPALSLFLSLLLLLPLFSSLSAELALFSHFFQAGSLVFGGGHVVLPLLENLLATQVDADTFLTGYATAQAVPGPMFTFATFLGFEINTQAPFLGAMIATVAIFLPGFLLIIVVLKNWENLVVNPAISGALTAVNATVVGLLLAALYQPIFQSSVSNALDMALAILGVYLLKGLKLPIVALVTVYILLGGIFL